MERTLIEPALRLNLTLTAWRKPGGGLAWEIGDVEVLKEANGTHESSEVAPPDVLPPEHHPPASDDGGDGSAAEPSPAAAAVVAHPDDATDQPAPDEEGAKERLDVMSVAELQGEVIDKLLKLASDNAIDPPDALEILDTLQPIWADKLPDHSNFLKHCFQTATKVIKGELKIDAARRFLSSMKER